MWFLTHKYMFQFINQQTDLENLLDLMSQNSIYGLDTEFIKVDTFWPKLGVFQVNVDNQIFLLVYLLSKDNLQHLQDLLNQINL